MDHNERLRLKYSTFPLTPIVNADWGKRDMVRIGKGPSQCQSHLLSSENERYNRETGDTKERSGRFAGWPCGSPRSAPKSANLARGRIDSGVVYQCHLVLSNTIDCRLQKYTGTYDPCSKIRVHGPGGWVPPRSRFWENRLHPETGCVL